MSSNNHRMPNTELPVSLQAEQGCQVYRIGSCLSGFFYLLDTVQTAETKYQKCLKSLRPFTANRELCLLNSNFYLYCQHRIHAVAFSLPFQFVMYRGTASQTLHRRGGLSTFQTFCRFKILSLHVVDCLKIVVMQAK